MICLPLTESWVGVVGCCSCGWNSLPHEGLNGRPTHRRRLGAREVEPRFRERGKKRSQEDDGTSRVGERATRKSARGGSHDESIWLGRDNVSRRKRERASFLTKREAPRHHRRRTYDYPQRRQPHLTVVVCSLSNSLTFSSSFRAIVVSVIVISTTITSAHRSRRAKHLATPLLDVFTRGKRVSARDLFFPLSFF